MTDIDGTRETSGEALDLKLEVVVLPVSVDRARGLYQRLGWRLCDGIVRGEDFPVVQLTPPGSACSIISGTGITSAAPGSADSPILVVQDLEAARADLIGRGADVSEVFHEVGSVFHRGETEGRVPGPDPEGRSYASFASFSGLYGNGWLLQEIETRLPGR